jgi:phage gpG-like protein
MSFITNISEVTANFAKLADRVENPRPVLQAAQRILSLQESQVWATEGGALGVTWAALVQPERHVGRSLLWDTGALRASMTTGGRIAGDTLRISPRSRAFYGFFHQFGTTNMDARPFSGISDESARLIMQEMRRATGLDQGSL